MTELLKKFNTDTLVTFFNGRIYPLVICALALISSCLGLEIFCTVLHLALLIGALLLANTVKPAIISLLTMHLFVSRIHSPFYPNYSDYIFSGWRLVFVIICAVLVFAAILTFFIKNKLYKNISLTKTPLLLPLAVLSVAFLLNGAFSDSWSAHDLPLAIAHAAAYLVVFLFVYLGLSSEKEGLTSYISYIAMLVSLVISVQLALRYIFAIDEIIVAGEIVKGGTALGWGIWNLVGASLVVLIPLIFAGMSSSRYPWLHFAAATVTYVMAVLSLSRNALVVGTVVYAASVIIFAFSGKYKTVFRIIAAIGTVAAAVLLILLWDKLFAALTDDNGRYNIWTAAWESFLRAPLFGSGFSGLIVETDLFGPLPKMAHNLILQLLSAMGIFGILAYAYFLYESVRLVKSTGTVEGLMLSLSPLALLLGSMLDNFAFNVYPMFLYMTVMAIIAKTAKK